MKNCYTISFGPFNPSDSYAHDITEEMIRKYCTLVYFGQQRDLIYQFSNLKKKMNPCIEPQYVKEVEAKNGFFGG
jgi:hypothetical protein